MSEDTLTSTFTRLRRRYFSQALRILHNEDDADDILQEAFCRLWPRRGSIHNDDEAAALATTTVHNLCIDNLRRQDGTECVPLLTDKADTADEGSEDEDREEQLVQVERLVDSRLTPLQRDILHRKEYEGESYEEIARALDMQPAAVRMQLSRSRKLIRECYLKQNKNE